MYVRHISCPSRNNQAQGILRVVDCWQSFTKSQVCQNIKGVGYGTYRYVLQVERSVGGCGDADAKG